MPTFRLGDIASALGGELQGDPDRRITRIGPLATAAPDTLTHLSAARLAPLLAQTSAGCIIVGPALAAAAAERGAVIVTPDPYVYYARLSQWWALRTREAEPPVIHPTAVIDPTAAIGAGVAVGALTVVDAHAVLADGVVIGPQCHIGAGARLGAGTRFAAQVVFGHGCSIGPRGVVHSGAVIGADGFGFAPTAVDGPDGGRWEKIEQFGNVRIGCDVEIGANTCIDRGSLDDTVIGDGVKLDNLIQIGHNSRLGKHTLMCGCAATAGSADIGAHCIIGPSAGVGGHFKVVDGVHVLTMAMVSHAITEPGVYGGAFPIDDQATYTKNAATLRQLHTLRTRVRELEKTVRSQAGSVVSATAAATDPQP